MVMMTTTIVSGTRYPQNIEKCKVSKLEILLIFSPHAGPPLVPVEEQFEGEESGLFTKFDFQDDEPDLFPAKCEVHAPPESEFVQCDGFLPFGRSIFNVPQSQQVARPHPSPARLWGLAEK